MFGHSIGAVAGARRGLLTLIIERYPILSGKAHICLVTDHDLAGTYMRRTSLDRQDHTYRVALVRKTPTNKQEATELFIARELFARGRIRMIER